MLLHGILKRALIASLGLVVASAAAASCSSPCGAQGQSCCSDSCNSGLACYAASDTCVQAGSGTFTPPGPVTSDAGAESDAGEDSAATATEDAGPDAADGADGAEGTSDAGWDAADASDGTTTEDAAVEDAAGRVADSGDAGG